MTFLFPKNSLNQPHQLKIKLSVLIMSNVSRKRKSLSNEDKIKIATGGNYSIASMSRMYDVSYSTVSRAIKRKHSFEEGIKNGMIYPTSKKQRTCQFPEIETELIKWIHVARTWKYPVTKQVIKVVAISMKTK